MDTMAMNIYINFHKIASLYLSETESHYVV